MKATVRYYTQTGNTKKLADAIAAELGIEAKSKGSFKVLHKGKPDAEDLKAVSAFAGSVIV